MMKICSKCKCTKTVDSFHKNKSNVDGLSKYCKPCKSMSDIKSYENHKDVRLAAIKSYHQLNKDEINRKRRNNKNEKLKHKEYRHKNPDKIKKWKQEYYQRNKAKINAKWAKMRREILDVRLANNLRARLNKALRGNHKGSSTIDLLGCSLLQLKVHLESGFQEGMNWNNYGKEWHIDHIKPCSLFDLKIVEEQKKCFNFHNLQPLWKIDNLRKNKYYDDKKG